MRMAWSQPLRMRFAFMMWCLTMPPPMMMAPAPRHTATPPHIAAGSQMRNDAQDAGSPATYTRAQSLDGCPFFALAPANADPSLAPPLTCMTSFHSPHVDLPDVLDKVQHQPATLREDTRAMAALHTSHQRRAAAVACGCTRCGLLRRVGLTALASPRLDVTRQCLAAIYLLCRCARHIAWRPIQH